MKKCPAAKASFSSRTIRVPARSLPGSPRQISSSRSKPLAVGCAKVSAVDFAHHNVDAAEDDHHIRDGVTEAHVFKNCEIDEARRPDAVTIGIRSAVTDQIKSELAFRRFDPSVRFAHRRTKDEALHLPVRHLPRRDL